MTAPARTFDPNEARDPDGKWTSGGGVAGKVAGYVSAAKTSAADWSSDDIADVMAANKEDWNRDDQLLTMWRKQGFTGKPSVVSKAEFDALSPDHVKVFRGLHTIQNGDEITEADDMAEQFRTGAEPYPGLGLYGNGTYTTTKETRAQEYASPDQRGRPGAMLRMALRPDARIAVMDRRDLDHLLEGQNVTPEITAMLRDDPGKLATLLGYDAIERRDTVIVLNRSAVIVQEAD